MALFDNEAPEATTRRIALAYRLQRDDSRVRVWATTLCGAGFLLAGALSARRAPTGSAARTVAVAFTAGSCGVAGIAGMSYQKSANEEGRAWAHYARLRDVWKADSARVGRQGVAGADATRPTGVAVLGIDALAPHPMPLLDIRHFRAASERLTARPNESDHDRDSSNSD